MSEPAAPREAPALARLLEVIREVAIELHPHRRDSLDVTLATTLSGELALDSMGRMELLARVDQTFGVTLPEHVVVGAETVRDLWHALEAAPQHAPGGLWAEPAPTSPNPDAAQSGAIPAGASTLLDVLEWHVAAHPDRVHLNFIASDEHVETLTYDGLRRGAEEVAAGLRGLGVGVGQTVALMLPTSLDFFLAFMGILRAGCIPVPIYPPARLHLIEDHLRRHATILESARAVLLITVPEAARAGRFLRAHARTIEAVVTVAEVRGDPAGKHWPKPSGKELALLQYTSGSTGNPKGVMLTHANLLANIRAMGQPFDIDPERDVFVSWLPLYHDMGLIGAWLGSLYFGMKLVVMSPLHFLARPERWLWAIQKYRGTLSAAPNFGYELCLTRIKDEDIAGLDLSSWRVAANGAEAVLPSTLRTFQERFARYGLSPTTQRPVYGLAECSVGLAFPAGPRAPLVDRVTRDEFTRSGVAVPANADDVTAIEFVGCGQPIPGHEIRVVDGAGREAPDREEGNIQCKGPSTTQGYFRNHKATRALFAGDWLRTGDRGYMVQGEIFVTGREKDIVKRAGRTLFAPEIEARVGDVPGVRKGCVAVFGARKGRRGTESLVVMAETRETEPAALEKLRDSIGHAIVATIGEPPNDIVLVRPHTVLKTSSGKIRRSATRQLYESGDHESGRRAVWVQMVRLALASIAPEARDWVRRTGDAFYAVWWWLAFSFVAAFVWPLVTLFPAPKFARRILRGGARLFLLVTGAGPTVLNPQRMPKDGPLVIVSNHTSYLDSVVLAATLPRDFAFVAKNSLSRSIWTGPFLRHLGTLFVERDDPKQGVEDLAAIAEQMRSGGAILFFPEGTLGRMAGLLPFRTGTFTVATTTQSPVSTVAIRGARTTLRDGSWFPRRTGITVAVGPVLRPEGTGWEATLALRGAVRAEMLRHTGEPDLYYEIGAIEGMGRESARAN